MERERAVNIVLSLPRNKQTLERLLIWDESLTLPEIAEELGVSQISARMFGYRFNLGFKENPRWSVRRSRYGHDELKNRVLAKWSDKRTIYENAKALDISPLVARTYACRFRLPYQFKKKNGELKKRVGGFRSKGQAITEQMRILRSHGMTLDKIGNIYGITRERVRQRLL